MSPGSRFRCLQFFPELERRGISCEVQFAYDERYNEMHHRAWAPLYKLYGRTRRAGRLVFERGHDLVYQHKTTLAFSGLPEWLRGFRSTPSIFDFDDAIYLAPDGAHSPTRASAFRQAVASADHVIAAMRTSRPRRSRRGRRPSFPRWSTPGSTSPLPDTPTLESSSSVGWEQPRTSLTCVA